jgi:hypothetical protein
MTKEFIEEKEAEDIAAKGKGVSLILILLVVVAAAASIFFYRQYSMLAKNPNAENQKKIEVVVAKVDKLMELPKGETPTLATVTDTKDLAKQPFFAKAKVGDQVLLYANARKAFLYDPVANIVVEVASLSNSAQ